MGYIEQDFQLRAIPLSKSMYRELPNGNLLLKLVVSDDSLDLQKQITEARGFRDSLPYLRRWGTVNWDHAKGPGGMLGEFRGARIGKSPITGKPALIGLVELYRRVPAVDDIKRILDSDGTIGASVQGKILAQRQVVMGGVPVVRNIRCLAQAVALTRQPVNPNCGVVSLPELAKSFAADITAEDNAIADEWAMRTVSKALTAGSTIAVDGSIGGAAIRRQSLHGYAMCPHCGGKTPRYKVKCMHCRKMLPRYGHRTLLLGKSQLALFGGDAPGQMNLFNQPEPSPGKQDKKPKARRSKRMLPKPRAGAAPEAIQHKFGESADNRIAAHDAWHQQMHDRGIPVEHEHHQPSVVRAMFESSAKAGDTAAARFHEDHLRHIADFHGDIAKSLSVLSRSRDGLVVVRT